MAIDNKVVEIAGANEEKHIRGLIQVIKELKNCLFLLMIILLVMIKFLMTLSANYFLPRVKIENRNIEIDGRNFYDQRINDSIKQYDEVRKYRQDKVMITRLVFYWILLILKRNRD